MRLRHIATANAAFFSGSQILFVPLFPWLAERMQAPLAHVLACFSAGSFLFLWGAPFWARRSDRDGRIPVLLIGSTGLALAFSLTAFLGLGLVHGHAALALLLFARIVYGLFAAATAPVAQACSSEVWLKMKSSTRLMPSARSAAARACRSAIVPRAGFTSR